MRKKSKIWAVIPAQTGIWALLILLSIMPASIGHAAGVRVLELYTSQGCSSCPPADRIFLDIAREPGVIAFACHITYFDRLGWTDNFSLPECDARQSLFKRAGVSAKSFTPQAIINGRAVAVGHHESAVRKALASEDPLPVIELRQDGGYLNIHLPALNPEKPVTLWIMGYDRLHEIRIPRGENSGAVIRYANAVRHMRRMMEWDGGAARMTLPVGDISADGYIAFAQYADNTDIIAAGKTGD